MERDTSMEEEQASAARFLAAVTVRFWAYLEAGHEPPPSVVKAMDDAVYAYNEDEFLRAFAQIEGHYRGK